MYVLLYFKNLDEDYADIIPYIKLTIWVLL